MCLWFLIFASWNTVCFKFGSIEIGFDQKLVMCNFSIWPLGTTDFIFLAGEFSLQSDGSSTNTSAANTPDSGDALDESTDSGVASMGSGSGMA